MLHILAFTVVMALIDKNKCQKSVSTNSANFINLHLNAW